MPEPWHACELHYSDSQIKRFGPDERDDADVPHALEFGTTQPGGFANGSIVLPRPPKLRADDAALFSHGIFYGPSGTLYEGRIKGIPQVGANEIRLQFEGWSAHLDDDESLRFLGVDSRLNAWTKPPSLTRQLELTPNPATAGITYDVGSSSTEVADDAALVLSQSHIDSDGANPGKRTLAEAWYDAGGLPIGVVYHDTSTSGRDVENGGPLTAAGGWNVRLTLADSDALATGFEQRDCLANPSGYFIATTGSRRYANVQMFANGVFTGDGLWKTLWKHLRVYGTHGLTRQADGGLRFSDILAHVLRRSAPMLTFTLGDSIEPSPFSLTHFAYVEPTTLRKLIEDGTSLSANLVPNDWGVYENRGFFHRSAGSYGRTWRVRKDQVATPTSQGPDAEARVGGFFVTWSDGAGRTHSAGPPDSDAELETETLLDTDPQNPANRLSRKWHHRNLGTIAGDLPDQQTKAVYVARFLMEEANGIDWRGDVELAGEVTDAAGNTYPAGEVRAGDRIVTEDDEYPQEQPIVSTSYSDEELKVNTSIGAAPMTGEVMLAQLAAATERAAA